MAKLANGKHVLVREVVRTPGGNSIRREIDASGAALQLFSPADRNRVIRDAMWQGGEYWRVTFLPLRFAPYAAKLGYHAGTKYQATKLAKTGRALPLVLSGTTRDLALSTSKVEARATASRYYVLIRFVNSWIAIKNKMVNAVLRSLHPTEVDRVAVVVGRALTEDIEIANEDAGRLYLSEGQRTSIDRRSKARQSPGAKSRKSPTGTARRVA